MDTTNLASRAGRWSASHWKRAAFGWLAFAVLAVAVGGAVGAKQMNSWAYANGESRRAEEILDRGNFKIPARESVLVQSHTVSFGEQTFTAAVASVVQTLSGEADVTNIVSPIDHPRAGLVSRDRHSALVQFDVKGKADKAKGFVIYAGQGGLEKTCFRVANMGALGEADFAGFLAALREALGATHGARA